MTESWESSMRTTLGQRGGKGASLNLSTCALVCSHSWGAVSKLHLMNWLVVSGLFDGACRQLDPGQDLTSAPRWVEKKIGVKSRGSAIVWLLFFGNLILTRRRVCAKTGSVLKAGQQKTCGFWTETKGKLPVVLLRPDSTDVPPQSDCLFRIKNKCVGFMRLNTFMRLNLTTLCLRPPGPDKRIKSALQISVFGGLSSSYLMVYGVESVAALAAAVNNVWFKGLISTNFQIFILLPGLQLFFFCLISDSSETTLRH